MVYTILNGVIIMTIIIAFVDIYLAYNSRFWILDNFIIFIIIEKSMVINTRTHTGEDWMKIFAISSVCVCVYFFLEIEPLLFKCGNKRKKNILKRNKKSMKKTGDLHIIIHVWIEMWWNTRLYPWWWWWCAWKFHFISFLRLISAYTLA